MSAVFAACATPGGGGSHPTFVPVRPPQPTWVSLPRGTVGQDALGRVALKDLGKPVDPPAVAKAMEHRELEPKVALSMLREVWLKALEQRDVTLAAYALDRSGDVLMDLGGPLLGDEALLNQVGAPESSASTAASSSPSRPSPWNTPTCFKRCPQTGSSPGTRLSAVARRRSARLAAAGRSRGS